ncbi:hypothetical protein ACWD4B_33840 [Streptomyces sp. NPDC002536]
MANLLAGADRLYKGEHQRCARQFTIGFAHFVTDDVTGTAGMQCGTIIGVFHSPG